MDSMSGWDEVCDFVVVGSGGGAVSAALAVKQAGKKPLIVEKQAVFGGSTAHSGGVWWVPNNPLLACDGIPDSYDRARQYLANAVGEYTLGSSPERRETFLKKAPEMVEFLERSGMQFKRVDYWPDYYCDLPGGEEGSRSLVAPLFNLKSLGEWHDKVAQPKGDNMPVTCDEIRDLMLLKRTWAGKWMALKFVCRQLKDKLTGSRTVGLGQAIQGRMLQLALNERVPLWLNSPVEGLIVENGTVVGVNVKRDGKLLRVKATLGVLLNVGGFSHNIEMREKYQPSPTSVDWTSSNPGDTGELMDSCIQLGAGVECMEEAWWIVTSIGIDGNTSPKEGARAVHHMDLAKPHLILVDQGGQRFANESGAYMEIGQRLYKNHQTGNQSIPCWAILDSRHRNRYLWGTGMPGKPPKKWLESGYMKQAGTLEELAKMCGIDTGGLKATVERFNRFANEGVDKDFGRGGREFDRRNGDPTVTPNPSLGAIEAGPFYAVALYPGDVGTAGGLVTDTCARVLREDGSIINGLYATGNTTSSVMGRCYPGAGASISASFTFGYLAAVHACQGQV